MSNMTRRNSVRRAFLTFVGVFAGALAMPAVAHAHTDFDYSLPTDGASVGEPVDEITVAFTLPVTLVGNGFEVLDPQNNVLEPFAVTDDDTVFRLQLDPPLAGGTVAVKYEVRAEDGHVLTGNVVFAVDAPVPSTASPATVPPTTSGATTPPEPVVTDAPTTAAQVTTTTAPVEPTDDEAAAVAGDAEVEEVAAVVPGASGDDGDSGGGSGAGVFIAIAAAVALGAGGFLLVRPRTSGAG